MNCEYPSLYFVRHAESLHNQRATLVRKMKNLSLKDDISKIPEYLQVKYGADYFDCGITEGGYKECEGSRQKCQNLDIGLVLVSPLRRALVTCYETFRTHKNKPRVIVIPEIGERMTSACDLGARLRQSMTMYPDYDFDEFKQKNIEDTWYIENLPPAKRERVYDSLKASNASNAKEIGLTLLELLKVQGHLESTKEVAQRVQQFKKKLVKYFGMTDKKIAIVGHSNMIESLTATGFKEDGTPINGIKLENCEVSLVNLVLEGVTMDAPKTVCCA